MMGDYNFKGRDEFSVNLRPISEDILAVRCGVVFVKMGASISFDGLKSLAEHITDLDIV